jgi:oligopeptide/dipeptide ABC transporter ATP-binding protein
MSDSIGVMYLGRILEAGGSSEVCGNPLHPYTRALLSAARVSDPGIGEGGMLAMTGSETGCRFAPRCCHAKPECLDNAPELREIVKGHFVACHFL